MSTGPADPGPHDPGRLPRAEPVDPATLAALDLRIGRVIAVAEFPEARHPAWKLTVDFGPAVGHLRTSARVTGYGRDELVGRLVVGAINIGDKRIAGFVSEFLLLGGLRPDGAVSLLGVDPGVEPGAPVA